MVDWLTLDVLFYNNREESSYCYQVVMVETFAGVFCPLPGDKPCVWPSPSFAPSFGIFMEAQVKLSPKLHPRGVALASLHGIFCTVSEHGERERIASA